MSRPMFLACSLALLLTGGCGSTPEATVDVASEAIATRGEVTVVVWLEAGGPVPARGTVTSLSTTESLAFDTRESASKGMTLSLEAGRYAVAVESRYEESGSLRPVKGERVFYLEPNAHESLRVVVSDRDDDIGSLRTPRTSHAHPFPVGESAPRLPASAPSSAKGS